MRIRSPTKPNFLRPEEKIPFGNRCRQLGWGQGDSKPASLRHPCPGHGHPDSRGSSCNHTGTRLQSHRDSSWRCQGLGRRAWPGGTGPVADSKKTCNTHCSLDKEARKNLLGILVKPRVKGDPKSSLGLPKDCLSQ